MTIIIMQLLHGNNNNNNNSIYIVPLKKPQVTLQTDNNQNKTGSIWTPK